MRRSLFILAIIVVSGTGIYGQSNPGRSAANFHRFLTVMSSYFLQDEDSTRLATDTLGPPGSGHEYVDYGAYDTLLGLNCERREVMDQPTRGLNPKMLKVGLSATSLDYMWYRGEWSQIIFQNAIAERFEMERHLAIADVANNDSGEYDGFLEHDGLGGRHHLIGLNTHDSGATSPAYAKRSFAYGADTSVNCLKLRSSDPPGYFGDSLWNPTFWGTNGLWSGWAKFDSSKEVYPGRDGCVTYHWQDYPDNVHRKVGLRFRIRMDGATPSDYSPSDTVFRINVHIKHSDTLLDTFQFGVLAGDSGFIHSPTAYDTVTVRFMRPEYMDSTFITLYWPGIVPVTIDWMEALTTKFEPTDNPTGGGVGRGIMNPDPSHYNEGLTYETMTANNDTVLKEAIDSLKTRYNGYYPLIETQEEPPLGQLRTIKRAIKILRDLSGDSMEFITSMHDSLEWNRVGLDGLPSIYGNISFYGMGLPNQPSYFLEGVRLGWLDSSLYADPKFFWTGFSAGDYSEPTPRRTMLSGDALHVWEAKYTNTGVADSIYGGPFYDPDRYLSTIDSAIQLQLRHIRTEKRICVRNSAIKQKFFSSFEIGTDHSVKEHRVSGGYRRTPTAAQMRMFSNIPVSCGASGLYLWTYNGTDVIGLNGDTTSNWITIHTAGQDSLWWDGHKEHFDALRSILPTLRLYGDTLLNASYQGDWTAPEANFLTTAPFVGGSIASINDSGVKDVFSLLGDTVRIDSSALYADTSLSIIHGMDTEFSAVNRTLVHVSEWLDTVGGQNDTLLYITNMRTDDSYVIDSTTNPGTYDTVPGTFDRRYITMKMKAPHMVTDIADTLSLRTMGKIRTPYVGAGDSLVVWLLPGDGVLVRLSPALPGMKQMKIALNYPKPDTTPLLQNKYDHGQVKFSEYVVGANPTTYLIPSSLYSYVGIADTAAPTLHQDSLLYQKFSSDRHEKWRHQNWKDITGANFGFKRQLLSISGITPRSGQTGLDSIAHYQIDSTDVEAHGAEGVIGFYDPFYVDSVTYRNFNTTSDTLSKSVPFIPNSLPAPGSTPGADPLHYGGVFLHQNDSLRVDIPNYALKAFLTFRDGTLSASDSAPEFVDRSFLEWHKGDVNYPDTIVSSQAFPVVFQKDSEVYTALYKVHNVAYVTPYSSDTGYSYNNQRKLMFLGRDNHDTAWYRNVYSSLGRIYTAVGWHTGVAGPYNGWMYWNPEQLVTEWNDSTACFPALAMRIDSTNPSARDTGFSYVYQQVDPDYGTPQIYRTTIVNGIRYHEEVSNPDSETLQPESTPVIATVDVYEDGTSLDIGQWDVIAYGDSGDHGITVRIMSRFKPGIATTMLGPWYFGTTNAKLPTIWTRDSSDQSSIHSPLPPPKGTTYINDANTLYLAWQDTNNGYFRNVLPIAPSVWDIFARKLVFNLEVNTPPIPSLDTSAPVDTVSLHADPQSFDNKRPCISGIRLGKDTTVVMIAYETNEKHLTDSLDGEGVAVALTRRPTNTSWSRATYFTGSWDHYTGDSTKLLKPSIECTRYTNSGGGWTKTNYYYSLACEAQDGPSSNVWHFALDDSTQRVTYVWIENLRNPQLSVAVNGHDSDVERMALFNGVGSSRWLIHQNDGLFKISFDHNTLYEYRTVNQFDTLSLLHIRQGVGEMQTDDGLHASWIDLVDRDDSISLDSVHNSSYFLGTEDFTLPASGQLTYTPWIITSNDSLFSSSHQKIKLRLDFFDTAEHYLLSLDSFFICDTLPKVTPSARNIILDLPSSSYGHLKLETLSGALSDSGSVQEIITPKRLSALKQADGSISVLQTNSDDIQLLALNNPTNSYCDIGIYIPSTGPVSIMLFDALGRQVGAVADLRPFSTGEHVIRWVPDGNLSSGIYTIVMRYGNSLKSTNVAYVR